MSLFRLVAVGGSERRPVLTTVLEVAALRYVGVGEEVTFDST